MRDVAVFSEKQGRDRWEIEDDLRTLTRAEEIKKDPERLKDAQDLLKEKRAVENTILGTPVPTPNPGRKNPATVGRIRVSY